MMHLPTFSKKPATSPRGFTLLISIILSSVVLAVGLALMDVAFKQVILAATSRQSQYAFYAADSALECALYWDQRQDLFDYISEPASGLLSCQGFSTITYNTIYSGSNRITNFTIPCAGSGSQSDVLVYKQATGVTTIYANGYNNCNTGDPHRIERGEKSTY